MSTNRRNWIKHIGLGVAGITLSRFESSAHRLNTDIQVRDEGPVRLSSNENPYGPSPLALRAMSAYFSRSNRYNWDIGSSLITALAKLNQVAESSILLGAGSTELLDLTVRYTAREKGNFIIAEPSYNYWTDTAIQMGLSRIQVPLTAGKSIDLDAILRSIRSDTRLIYICNPNNPTGTICEPEALLHFVEEATRKTLVLIDEAYIDYTATPSLAHLTGTNRQLVIVKTFSKIYGLAGARVGYAIAHPDTLEQMSRLQSWNNGSISAVSVAAALASVKDHLFLKESFAKNISVKQYTMQKLQQMKLNVIPSASNFLYFSLEGYPADYFQRLKDHQISGTKIYEEKGRWTRITIGTNKEMERFAAAIRL